MLFCGNRNGRKYAGGTVFRRWYTKAMTHEAAHEVLAPDAPAMPPPDRRAATQGRLASIVSGPTGRRMRSGIAARSAPQLLIAIVAVDIVAALVAGGVTILRARTATRIEIAASTSLPS